LNRPGIAGGSNAVAASLMLHEKLGHCTFFLVPVRHFPGGRLSQTPIAFRLGVSRRVINRWLATGQQHDSPGFTQHLGPANV
jgi:hypothetical protein